MLILPVEIFKSFEINHKLITIFNSIAVGLSNLNFVQAEQLEVIFITIRGPLYRVEISHKYSMYRNDNQKVAFGIFIGLFRLKRSWFFTLTANINIEQVKTQLTRQARPLETDSMSLNVAEVTEYNWRCAVDSCQYSFAALDSGTFFNHWYFYRVVGD